MEVICSSGARTTWCCRASSGCRGFLLVGFFLNVDEVVGHGLVGELVEDGADGVEASLHYQQLGLGLLLSQSETNTQADVTKVREEEGRTSR